MFMNRLKLAIAIMLTAIATTAWSSTVMQATEEVGDETETFLDSLINAMNRLPEGEEQLKLLDKISYEHYNADSTYKYAFRELELSKKLKNDKYITKAYRYLIWAKYIKQQYAEVIEDSYRLIMRADSMNDLRTSGLAYMSMANSYCMLTDYVKADELYQQAYEKYKEAKDTAGLTLTMTNIAHSDLNYGLYNRARDYFNEIIEISKKTGNQETMSDGYSGLGSSALEEFRSEKLINPNYKLLEEGKEYFEIAQKLIANDNSGYSYIRLASQLSPLLVELSYKPGLSNKEISDLKEKSLQILSEAMTYAEQDANGAEAADVKMAYIGHLLRFGTADEALKKVDELKNSLPDGEMAKMFYKDIYKAYSKIYEKKGDIKEAIRNSELSNYWDNKTKNSQYVATSSESIAQVEYNEKIRERDKKAKEQEIMIAAEMQTQKVVIISAIIILILLTATAFIAIRSAIKRQKINEMLDEKNAELEQQQEEILRQNSDLEERNADIALQKYQLESQNKQIMKNNMAMTDSLNYASIIQKAAMPSRTTLGGIFGDHALVFRPLQVVSGDFYWATEVDGIQLLAVADCTGHGVPGAFLSMLGISILNELSNKTDFRKVNAGEILDLLRKQFENVLNQKDNIKTLKEKEDGTEDGMDMAFIKIDKQTRVINYAGAFRPLIIISDGEMRKIDADRMPIGIHYKEAEHFTDHELKLNAGDTIYMFTDGMTDQFGYDSQNNIHKFTAKRLRTLLQDIHRFPFSLQETKLEMEIDDWRSSGLRNGDSMYEQTDDALLIGIRIN